MVSPVSRWPILAKQNQTGSPVYSNTLDFTVKLPARRWGTLVKITKEYFILLVNTFLLDVSRISTRRDLRFLLPTPIITHLGQPLNWTCIYV